ncbi:unnamed protein product [Sphagnum balticum]
MPLAVSQPRAAPRCSHARNATTSQRCNNTSCSVAALQQHELERRNVTATRAVALATQAVALQCRCNASCSATTLQHRSIAIAPHCRNIARTRAATPQNCSVGVTPQQHKRCNNNRVAAKATQRCNFRSFDVRPLNFPPIFVGLSCILPVSPLTSSSCALPASLLTSSCCHLPPCRPTTCLRHY